MPSAACTESEVEEATLCWFAELGYGVAHGEEIAPEGAHAERESFGDVLLVQRLCDALLPKLLSGEIRVADAERIAGRYDR